MTLFRPCIDLHEGQVKQIVGGSLLDSGADTNFVSDKQASHGAKSLDDSETVQDLSGGKLDLTVGSAMDIFGGTRFTLLPSKQKARLRGLFV